VHYTSALALAWPDGRVVLGSGRLAGDLVWPQRGDGGAPFDQAFQPDGFGTTLGELDAQQRGRRNPRALALHALERALDERGLGAAPGLSPRLSRESTP
jgi:XTP/dITP diphosphohydrolase